MNKNDYISVSEFSKKVGVSRQAIYKRLNTDLSTYVVNVDNKQMLSTKAFELFILSTEKENLSTLSTVDTLDRLVKHLENEIGQLRTENEALKLELMSEREQNRTQGAELIRLSSQVGESLKQLTTERAVTQTKLLADTLIDGQRSSEPPKKTHWWQKAK